MSNPDWVHPGSESWFFTHPGSRGSKRHQIPDPDPQNTGSISLRMHNTARWGPDPNFFHPGSLICFKELLVRYFNPKNLFLGSRKYDPGCSSRILNFYPSRIQRVKTAPDPGSGSATVGVIIQDAHCATQLGGGMVGLDPDFLPIPEPGDQ